MFSRGLRTDILNPVDDDEDGSDDDHGGVDVDGDGSDDDDDDYNDNDNNSNSTNKKNNDGIVENIPHCAASCLQNARSSGQDFIVRKSCSQGAFSFSVIFCG